MGQRLAITMYYNGDAVASAYYHGSAYTAPAIRLLKAIRTSFIYYTRQDGIEETISKHADYIKGTKHQAAQQLAIDLLHGTGAEFYGNRNDGLINITDPEEFKEAGEYTIDVYLDTGTFDFNVINSYDTHEADIGLEKEEQLKFFNTLNSNTEPTLQLRDASFYDEENWEELGNLMQDTEDRDYSGRKIKDASDILITPVA